MIDNKTEKRLNREKTEIKYKWNLADLFNSENDWRIQKQKVEKQVTEIEKFKGKISASADKLLAVLEFISNIQKEFYRLYAYAQMYSDQDTQESKPLAMKQEMALLGTQIGKAASFLEPELLKISQKKIKDFFAQNKKLKIFRQYIDDIQRRKKHTLSQGEEKLVAEAGRIADNAHEIFNIFVNADLPYPTISLSNGNKVRLDLTGYSQHRTSTIRSDRKKVFESFFSALEQFKRTFGTKLYGEVKKNIFYKNARKYDSCLERALDQNNIPISVYYKLIENVNKNLHTLHRYLNLRKKMLKVEKLYYYDVYSSLVKEIQLNYSYEQATFLVKDSLSVLGNKYISVLDRAFSERWIDVYPNRGKRSGAYMNGIAYDVHPYILSNYTGKYNDVSTLTHELGHAMHSYFSNKNQHFVNSHYPIFLAEVASTVNEALLIDNVLNDISDKNQRLSLLGNQLEGFRGTLFRQTQFAEFELKIHEIAESGKTLTGDLLSEIYMEIFRKYYGHQKGITQIDDLYRIEWAFIPHFYYNFYVFQYSTSFTAAQAIAEKILSREKGMVEKYIKFLSSGCSEYSIPTLQKLGVDMTANDPFEMTIGGMNNIMDEIEELIN